MFKTKFLRLYVKIVYRILVYSTEPAAYEITQCTSCLLFCVMHMHTLTHVYVYICVCVHTSMYYACDAYVDMYISI